MCDSSSAAYIRMVQHLIETCLTFNMSKEECMEALSKNANINPTITSTVWKELVKENKDFFETYEQKLMMKNVPMSEEETNQMIQSIISNSSDD